MVPTFQRGTHVKLPKQVHLREEEKMHFLHNDSLNRTNFQGDSTEFSQESPKLSDGKLDSKQQRCNIRYEELTRRVLELKHQDAVKQRQSTVRKRIPSETIQIIKSNILGSVSTPVSSCRLIKNTPKLKHSGNPVVVSTNYNSSFQQLATRHPRYVICSKEDPQIKTKTGQEDKRNGALYNMVKKNISNQRINIDSTVAKVRLHHKGFHIETTPKTKSSPPSFQTNSAAFLMTPTQSSITRTPKIQIDPPSSTQSPSIPNSEPSHPISDELSSLSDDSDTMTPIGENDKTITSPSMSVNNTEKEMSLLQVPVSKIDSEISTPRRSAYLKPSNSTVYKKGRLSIIIPSDAISAGKKESLPQNLSRLKNIPPDESTTSLSSSSITTPALNDEDLLSDLGSGVSDDQLTDVFDKLDSDDFNSTCTENIEKVIQVCIQNTMSLVPSCLSPISERSFLSHVSNKENTDGDNLAGSTQISSLSSNSRIGASEGGKNGSDILNEGPTNSLGVERSQHSKATPISEEYQKTSNHSKTNSVRSLPTTSSKVIDADPDRPSPTSSGLKVKGLIDKNNLLIKERLSRHSTQTSISDANQNISKHSKGICTKVANQNENPVWNGFIESPQINSPVLNSRNSTPEPPEDENLSCEAPLSVLTERTSSFSAQSPMSLTGRKTSSHSRTSNLESSNSTLYKISKSGGLKTPSRSQSIIGSNKTSSVPGPRRPVNSFHQDNRTISESRFSLSSSVGMRTNPIQH